MAMGNLYLGNLNKKTEELNKTGGINTDSSVFKTEKGEEMEKNPYSIPFGEKKYSSRVDTLANNGPLMETKIHTENSNDIAFKTNTEEIKEIKHEKEETKVDSKEKTDVLVARSDLKVFSGDVMKNGVFSPMAKEAARHFFNQLMNWAGSFNDGGSGFYKNMGINNLLDCLYVDGMSLRNYLSEQYYYKATGDPAQNQEMLRNYVALIAVRCSNVITMVRPTLKSDGADVEYRNLYLDLDNVGKKEASKSRKLKERGSQVRSNLKKRMNRTMTERTGKAYRKAYGYKSDNFERLEKAGSKIRGVENEKSEEFKELNKSFEKYNGGLQKLGLKPGRDDINLAVARELKTRCEDALEAADAFLKTGSKNEDAVKAAKEMKKALEKDNELLTKAIDTKLSDEKATMRLDEILNSNDPKDPSDPSGDSDPSDNNEDGSAK